MIQIATFEKVSLNEYIASRMILGEETLGDARYKEMVEQFTREWESIKLPSRSTEGSAGYDFFSPAAYHVYSDDSSFKRFNEVVCTGIRVRIEPGFVLLLAPRSGLGFKYGLRLANTIGVIDSDYYNADNEGHIKAKLCASDDVFINAGDRFMQGILVPFGIATNDSDSDLGVRTGGFGSTGK